MKIMRRSRWLARLVAMLVVGVAGLAVAASAPAQAGIVFQSHVMAAWGHGLLGDGGLGRSLYGDIKPAGNTVVQVAAGWYRHHLILRSDGTVWAWGRNGSGQLGDGTTTGEGMPVQVTGLTGVTQVAAGYDHSLALKSDGTVWAWGNNNHGQIGNGTSVGSLVPVQVPGLDHVTKISAGYGFSLALRSNGTVWAWGWNDKAQLGAFSTSPFSLVPVQVPGLAHVTGISAGIDHAVATATNGISAVTSVWAWGGNEVGQLGDGTLTSHGAKQVTGLPVSIAGIAAGGEFTTVLGGDGTVWAWGYDTSGQLGNAPSTSPVTRPVNTIGLGSGIIQLSAGGAHVLALKPNGTVLAWGNNQLSQLGIGSQASVTGPVQVTGLTSATQVAAGLDVSFAVHTVPYLVGL
jgi:alpha-tubulin suppressor-like RCC1 family protein